ncbi:MAG TPA: diadenylate cyclase [Acidimicrobiales bacterium]
MDTWHAPTPPQLRRLTEELAESGLVLDGSSDWHPIALWEISYALRPRIHERYVPSFGAIVAPTTDPATWNELTGLTVERGTITHSDDGSARRYADGIASWYMRHADGTDEWVTLDRQAGSERDVVVLATAMGATIVQRHPSGIVRVVGTFGVFRWDGLDWRHEPLVTHWIDGLAVDDDDRKVLHKLLEFAVHDLGARGIGATLIHRADPDLDQGREQRLGTPPPLRITRPLSLAPLRHALAQTDGATLFDADGTLEEIGVRLVPSIEAEVGVEGFRGMRHTAARRYSYDDPGATVIVVSEDGPVTVFRSGEVAGTAESIAELPIPPS